MDALNLDLPDVWWALGQALSRAYGAEPHLIPVVDCVNHSKDTTPPLTCALAHFDECNKADSLLALLSHFMCP